MADNHTPNKSASSHSTGHCCERRGHSYARQACEFFPPSLSTNLIHVHCDTRRCSRCSRVWACGCRQVAQRTSMQQYPNHQGSDEPSSTSSFHDLLLLPAALNELAAYVTATDCYNPAESCANCCNRNPDATPTGRTVTVALCADNRLSRRQDGGRHHLRLDDIELFWACTHRYRVAKHQKGHQSGNRPWICVFHSYPLSLTSMLNRTIRRMRPCKGASTRQPELAMPLQMRSAPLCWLHHSRECPLHKECSPPSESGGSTGLPPHWMHPDSWGSSPRPFQTPLQPRSNHLQEQVRSSSHWRAQVSTSEACRHVYV